jgi:hypothetical protein
VQIYLLFPSQCIVLSPCHIPCRPSTTDQDSHSFISALQTLVSVNTNNSFSLSGTSQGTSTCPTASYCKRISLSEKSLPMLGHFLEPAFFHCSTSSRYCMALFSRLPILAMVPSSACMNLRAHRS